MTLLPLTATARLQFHKGFNLDHGTALVPYFAKLGMSHIYASPLLKSRPGSMHGYDIVDHNQIDPELGGEDALRRLVAALREQRMGLILDIVPNHMGVGGMDNAWWMDVLEWGPSSPYAETFDIDWSPADNSLRNKILAPFLGASYGEALEDGALKLCWDDEDGRFFCSVYDEHRFPIAPSDYPAILRHEAGLDGIFPLLTNVAGGRDVVRRRAEQARDILRNPQYRAGIDHALKRFDSFTAEGRKHLHALLERQHYRLSWWRAAADEINWRRFFDVSSLAGVKVEVPHVFDATHAYILQLYAEGLIDGVRIDHVDGLAEPRQYCRKLRRRLQTETRKRPASLGRDKPVLWVEKILAPHERLASDWLTDGTTGYDYMNEVSGVLHDCAKAPEFSRIWAEHTGQTEPFETLLENARRQILRENLSSEWFAAATAIHRMARRDPKTRDYTLTAIRWALAEILAHFHVYRIYAGLGGMSKPDEKVLDWAMARARRSVRAGDRPLLELIGSWMAGTDARSLPPGNRRREWLRAMVKFQQLSSPLAAKSLEDTVFYRYGRLISRNEVGTEPSEFGVTPSSFHGSMRERQKTWRRALLTTATHDHKRGEDTRARLAALSEIPEEWESALIRWTRLNAKLKRDLDGPAPDGIDELMLYQSIIGAWPLDLRLDDEEGMASFRERLAAWQTKALREAKRRTTYTAPDDVYEGACQAFLTAVLDPTRPAQVAQDIEAFVHRLAAPGVVNSLSQMLLKLTSPGIPDTYQGTEFWDFSLVDPDNRRPVDFASRNRALAENDTPAALLADWRDGRVKLAVLHRVLQFRRSRPGLFSEGDYIPLTVEGPQSDHVLAFARRSGDRYAIIAITRLPIGLKTELAPLPPQSAWNKTMILLPDTMQGAKARDVFGSMDHDGVAKLGGSLAAAELFATLPVALLEVS